MRIRHTFATASLLAVALVSAACSGNEVEAGARSSATDAAPSATWTPEDRWPGLNVGAELGHEELSLGGSGMAWQIEDAVLLTSTGGLANGHLLGFDLDLRASGRLGAPVLTSGDEGPWMLTSDGLVLLEAGASLPLFDGATLEIGDGSFSLADEEGQTLATLDGTLSDLWISFTGNLVGNGAGEAWDVEQDAPYDLPEDCRVADRHEPGSELLVCAGADGDVIPGVELPELTTLTFVTVGTTGNEFIATAQVHGTHTLLVGDRASGTVDRLPGSAISYRRSGAAWVRNADGLGELRADGTVETLRGMPGVRGAMIWTR